MFGKAAFERLTELAAAVFDAPCAFVTVVDEDRQWFRAERGAEVGVLALEDSFCRRTLEAGPGGTMVVEDASRDARFAETGLVREGLRFYAGAVITRSDGHPDGAVCVTDSRSRAAPTPAQMEALKQLAVLASIEIDQARAERLLAERTQTLELAEAMAGVGHWRMDKATGQVWWSDELYRIHGLTPGEIDPTGWTGEGVHDPDDAAVVRTLLLTALKTGEGYEAGLKLTRPDGQVRHTRTRARCLRDETGAVASLFGVFQDVTEAVRGRERLERSEALFRLMSEGATDIIARYRPDGTILYLSPSVEAVLGRTPETLIGRTVAEIIHPEDVAATFEAMQTGMRGARAGEAVHVEYRATRPDGSVVWLEASPRAVRDADGRLTEIHDHVRDITRRKAAEAEQAKLVQTLDMAGHMAGLGHWRLDVAEGRVTWSDEVYRIHGVERGTFDPNYDDGVAFYHPDDRQAVLDGIGRAIETGEPGDFKLRLMRADGAERIVTSRWTPERDGQGKVCSLFGVFQDVTEAETAARKLAESEAVYRGLADRATDLIVNYTLDGRVTYVSPSIEALSGRKPEAVVGTMVTDLIHPDDAPLMQQGFLAFLGGGAQGVHRSCYRGFGPDGEVRWFEARASAVRDASGRIRAIQDVVRDVSEAKRMEEALIEARDRAEAGARAKSEFLANMSHELRTPLTSVIGFSSLLAASAALPDQERRFVERISTASEALLSVINDILDYSKLEADAVELEPLAFDPSEMARAAASMVEGQCQTRGLGLTVEIDPATPGLLMGDEGRLRQVVLNFLSNACKFTGEGGVTLKVGPVGERLRIAVADTGIGIAEDKVATLFQRFSQADASTTRIYGGTGLGLAISRRLVEMMGGEVGVESRPGSGSTFWLEIPMTRAGADAPAVAVEPETRHTLAGLRVLMADDTAANRELVGALLGPLGVRLTLASDGAEAVEAARTGGYDVILMDVHMPVLDGLEAARTIRALGGEAGRVPIIALTANVQAEQIERCRAAGMDGHAGKPIRVGELLAALAAASAGADERRDGTQVGEKAA